MDSVNLTPGPLRRIDLRGTTLSAAGLRGALPRGGVDVDAVVPTVRPIVDLEAVEEWSVVVVGLRVVTR